MESEQSNKMGVVQLTIVTAVNMMGSGIVMLPANLAQVGTVSVISWLVTAVGSTLLAYAFGRAGTFSNRPGGMGGYAEYAFGRSGNFLANYTYFLSLLVANLAIAVTCVGYGTDLFNADLSGVGVCGATIAVLLVATVANFWGARVTGRLSSITVWGVVIPVIGIALLGWLWFSPSMYVGAWNPHHYGFMKAVGSSISITLWAFLGMESACANTEAVENPKKNVPIAVMLGTVGAAIMYIASTNVIAGIVPNADLANSSAPFGLAFAHMFNPTVGKIVVGLMVISCFGSLLGWQFTIAEVGRSSARVGYFPRFLAKVNSHGAPVVGMCTVVGIQCLMALMTISPDLNRQFTTLVNLAVVTNVMPYLLSMAALPALQRACGVPVGKSKVANAVAVVATIYSLYACYAAGEQAMTLGSLVTFAGWLFYGLSIHRDANAVPEVAPVSEDHPTAGLAVADQPIMGLQPGMHLQTLGVMADDPSRRVSIVTDAKSDIIAVVTLPKEADEPALRS